MLRTSIKKLGNWFMTDPESVYCFESTTKYQDITMGHRTTSYHDYEHSYHPIVQEEGFIFTKKQFEKVVGTFNILGRRFLITQQFNLSMFPIDILVFKTKFHICKVHVLISNSNGSSIPDGLMDLCFMIDVYTTTKFSGKFMSTPMSTFLVRPSVDVHNYLFECLQLTEEPDSFCVIDLAEEATEEEEELLELRGDM